MVFLLVVYCLSLQLHGLMSQPFETCWKGAAFIVFYFWHTVQCSQGVEMPSYQYLQHCSSCQFLCWISTDLPIIIYMQVVHFKLLLEGKLSHVHFIHDSLALWKTQLGATTTVQPKTAHHSQIPGCKQHTLYSDTLQINPSYKLLMLIAMSEHPYGAMCLLSKAEWTPYNGTEGL